MKKLDLQELHDIMMGCAILGTGGGGSLVEGTSVVEKQWNEGKEFKLLDFSEIQDDAYYASPYYCGCMVPEEQEVEEELFDGSDIALSVRELEKYMNTNFHGVVSIEYGAGNTGEVMAIAAQTGKYIVDADAAGRAVPELQFSTYYVTGQPITPLAVGTIYGDVAIIPTVKEDARAEALTRFMAVATNGAVGMTDHPILGKDLKHAVIPGAISRAQKVGQARREAEENGQDPIQAILETAGGKRLFTGRVTGDTNWYDKDGFTLGDIYLDGIGSDEGHSSRVWYKNENMMLWIDGQVRLTCPDLICVLDRKTGKPITNPNSKEGMELCVLGFPCHELWKTPRALEILNPRFFGFDTDCVFLEE